MDKKCMYLMATFSSLASMVPEPSVSKRSKASLRHRHGNSVRKWGEILMGSVSSDQEFVQSPPDLLLLLLGNTTCLAGLCTLAGGSDALAVRLQTIIQNLG